MKFLWSEISKKKMDNLNVWPFSVEREELRSAFGMQFHHIAVSIFLKTCMEDHGHSYSRLQERRI